MIVTAPLNESQVVTADFITESETYLHEHGYTTDTVAYHLAINQKKGDENTGYVVKTVETTRVPLDEADVAKDTIELQICSCDAYRYSDGFDDLAESGGVAWQPCKHCEATDKTIKAANDDSQEEIV